MRQVLAKSPSQPEKLRPLNRDFVGRAKGVVAQAAARRPKPKVAAVRGKFIALTLCDGRAGVERFRARALISGSSAPSGLTTEDPENTERGKSRNTQLPSGLCAFARFGQVSVTL